MKDTKAEIKICIMMDTTVKKKLCFLLISHTNLHFYTSTTPFSLDAGVDE
jgi:hypothetical protein